MGIEILTATPALDTAAYATGDVIGVTNPLLTFTLPSHSQFTPKTGKLLGVRIIDLDDQKAPIDVLLFKHKASYSSTFTDQAAVAVAEGDLTDGSYLGTVHVLAGDYTDLGSESVADTWLSNPIPLDFTNDLRVRAALVSRGTPTYTAVGKMRVQLIIETE